MVKFDIFLWYPEIFLYAKAGMKRTLISKDVVFFFLHFFSHIVREYKQD